jgi:hypothetical protein
MLTTGAVERNACRVRSRERGVGVAVQLAYENPPVLVT